MNNSRTRGHGASPSGILSRFLSLVVQSIVKPLKRYISRELSSPAGFTLLELILSITILSLVALIIGSGFRLGIKAWERGNKELHATQRLRALSGLLLQDLKSVYPYRMIIDNKKVILFEGEENSILFVSTLGSSLQGGLKWMKYSYDDADRTLSYSEGVLPDKEILDTVKDKQRSEIVDDDMVKTSFEYYSYEEEDWLDTWDIGKEMPAAVRVHMEHYPSLFITLPMSPERTDKKGKENEGMVERF